MSTTLTPAHRTWRVRVFAATWLSYVGFYFCRKPFSAAKSAIGKEAHFDATTLGDIWAAYLIAYAIGQFLAAGMGTRLGPRKNVLLGTALSIVVTLAMGHTLSAPVLAGLVAVNGLAQATGWSGNVGTMASWFHRHERGRVMGLWATNFTVGSLVSAWVMAWVLSRHDEGAPPPWRACFTTGALVLSVVWCVFFLFQRNRPEDVGLAPVDDPQAADTSTQTQTTTTQTTQTAQTTQTTTEPEGFLGFTRAAWTNLMLVAVFYFFVKLIRYAVWSWAAFFLERNYGLTGTDANTYSTAFDLMGIPGVWVTGWLSDRVFGSRRADVALVMMLVMTAACGALMLFGGVSVLVFGVLLGVVGFSLFGPDALLTGAGAMDIGSRRAATFAAAIISGFGSLGPIVQELVIGRLYDNSHGDLTAVFGLLLVSAVCAMGTMAVAVVRNRRGHPPL